MNSSLVNSILSFDISYSHEFVLPTEHLDDAAQRPGGGNHSIFVHDDNVSDRQVSRGFVPFCILSETGQIVGRPSLPKMPH